MTPDLPLTKRKLTGKYKFKESFWTGSMVLWVQEQTTHYPNKFDQDLKNRYKEWRKATRYDIKKLKKHIKIHAN